MDHRSEIKNDYSNACFEGAIRDCEETVKIPNSFYSTWCNELSKRVILEDDYGNIFAVDIDVDIINNKDSANFGNGINTLKAFYNIKVGTVVHFKYVGKQTFKIRFPPGTVTPHAEFPEILPNRQLGSTPRTPMVKKRMLWESKIIREKLPLWKTVVIPENVVKDEFTNRPSTITVKLPNELEENWDIVWSTDIKGSNFGVLGRGWYNFCRKNNFCLDDKVQFWKVEGDDKLCVKIMRI